MMTNKMILASRNRGKTNEIREMLKGLNWILLSMADLKTDIEIIEDGATFEENAYKKALNVMEATGMIAIADDSGLKVDALDGMPGVHSARFAGGDATDEDNNRKLLKMMEGIPKGKRDAAFVCAATVMFSDYKYFTVRGECRGCILFEPKGVEGFGYDPLFYVPDYGKTFAELRPWTKNSISHRAMAFAKVREKLRNLQRGI